VTARPDGEVIAVTAFAVPVKVAARAPRVMVAG
jgi:hypothetical protein